MKLKMIVCAKEGHEPEYSKEVELPFLPPVGMRIYLGTLRGNCVLGFVTDDYSHNFETDTTEFAVYVEDPKCNPSELPSDFFCEADGWQEY